MPNQKTLTADDFNPEKKVENYRLYLKAEGLRSGDRVEPFRYQIWIQQRVREFRKMHNLSEFTSLKAFGYEKYMNYLREYADEKANASKGQISIYDFLEVAK